MFRPPNDSVDILIRIYTGMKRHELSDKNETITAVYTGDAPAIANPNINCVWWFIYKE